MKTKLVGLLTLVVATVIGMGASAVPSTVLNIRVTEADRPAVMVILGDSIGAGYGVGATQNYGELIRAEKGYDVRNRAISGARTAGRVDNDMVELLTGDTALALATQADVMEADIINITIGGNDMKDANTIFGSGTLNAIMAECKDVNDTEKVRSQQLLDYLAETTTIILDRIHELNPDALVVVFKNYMPPYHTPGLIGTLGMLLLLGTTDNMGLWTAANYVIPKLNDEIWGGYLTANPGAFVFSDSFTAMDSANTAKPYFASDLIHPNVAGHALLADILMATIDENMVRDVTADAFVTQLKGNRNELTITVTEFNFDRTAVEYEITYVIDNNAADFYQVGEYNVFVNTKGNTQIRDCYIAA